MALNKAIIMGRITHNLEMKQTTNGQTVLSFTIACDRYSKTEEKAADFISCVAWNKTAEFIGKYFGKGRMIAVTGTLHSRTYDDKNGSKHYVTEVFVDSADFTGEPKPAENAQNAPYSAPQAQGYSNAPAQPATQYSAPQTAQQANPNGYPSPYMYAPPREQPAPDTSADFADFEVFSEDGVPF
jgi:single-strand DNA-binding protein